MGELDLIRAPRRARFFRLLVVGVAVVLGLIASLQWWLQEPMPRLLIVLAVTLAIGWVAGRLMFRKMR